MLNPTELVITQFDPVTLKGERCKRKTSHQAILRLILRLKRLNHKGCVIKICGFPLYIKLEDLVLSDFIDGI